MSGHCSKISKQSHSPLKTMLRKLGNGYQAYCTTYKTQAMATHHGGAGCPVNSDINLHIEDTEGITGLVNDNESTSGLDTTVALGGPETEGHPDELIPANQTKLIALTREINDLHQWVEAAEGQPTESLDHIEWEQQNLFCASTTAFTDTYWAPWRSNTPVHWNLVYHTKANKPHKFLTTRYCCL